MPCLLLPVDELCTLIPVDFLGPLLEEYFFLAQEFAFFILRSDERLLLTYYKIATEDKL